MPTLETTTPAPSVAYFRMSENKQEASIPEQERWAARASTLHAVDIVKAFKDEGIAGDEIALRPGLQDLIAFCEERQRQGRPVKAVVCWDSDRFSRANSFSTAAVLDRLMQAGVGKMLTNAEGWIDFEDDMQRVFFNLRQDLGKRAYAQSVSAAVSRTRADRSREGRWTGGPPPWGYVLGAENHLALGDPVHVETVRWLFQQYLARDVGAYRLADELNARRAPFPTYRGRTAWTEDLVYNILGNPNYTGDLHYNRTTIGKYNRTRPDGRVEKNRPQRGKGGALKAVPNLPEDYIVGQAAHPAIIDRATFDAVQRKLAARRVGKGKRPGRGPSDYPFSGLCVCAECGCPMYGITVVKKDGDKRYTWRKYSCSRYHHSGGSECHYNTIQEDDLLNRVAEVLEERFAQPEALADLRAKYLARRRQQGQDHEEGARRLRGQIATLDAHIAQGNKNLAFARTQRDFDRVSEAVTSWEEERAGLVRQLDGIEQAAQAQEREEAGLDNALAMLQEAANIIRSASPDRLREVVKGLVEKIELRFEHQQLPSGRTRSVYVGGDIHLRGDLGCSPVPGDGSPTPHDATPLPSIIISLAMTG